MSTNNKDITITIIILYCCTTPLILAAGVSFPYSNVNKRGFWSNFLCVMLRSTVEIKLTVQTVSILTKSNRQHDL